MRPADWASIGLRVEATIRRVIVFRLTLRAHRERLHRSIRAVVGQRFNDAEARAAIRAVRERVAVTAVVRIENFAQAIGTSRDVGQHKRGFITADFAFADFKIRVAHGVKPRGFEALDETARWLFGFEPQKKLFKQAAFTLNFDENALRRVVDPAAQIQFRREPINKRAKAHALNRAAHGEFQARSLGGQRDCGSFHSPPQVCTRFCRTLNVVCQSLRRNCQKKWGGPPQERGLFLCRVLCMKSRSWRKRCGWRWTRRSLRARAACWRCGCAWAR